VSQGTVQNTGESLYQHILKFLRAPLWHLEKHPLYIKGIIANVLESHRDHALLMEAYQEMMKAVLKIKLVSWQMSASNENKDWCDFVVPESQKKYTGSKRTLQRCDRDSIFC
jgi:hypothetical protein